MAASRPMLEALLERVQKRAAERRTPGAEAPVAATRGPAARGEDEIEEYDDELIEIIEDGDVTSDEDEEAGPPEPRPLELSVSAPSVEMRRRVVAASPVPEAAATPLPLAAETVARRPVSADVLHVRGQRPDLKQASFVELLDASLGLGR